MPCLTTLHLMAAECHFVFFYLFGGEDGLTPVIMNPLFGVVATHLLPPSTREHRGRSTN